LGQAKADGKRGFAKGLWPWFLTLEPDREACREKADTGCCCFLLHIFININKNRQNIRRIGSSGPLYRTPAWTGAAV